MTVPNLRLREASVALVRVVLTGALAGFFGHWFLVRAYGAASVEPNPLKCAGVGILCAGLVGAGRSGARRLAERFVPVRSAGAVALHVFAGAATTLATLAVAFGVLERLLDFHLPFELMVVVTLFVLVVTSISQTVSLLSAARRRVIEAERAATEAELRALRAQVNPHFLFNALNSIASLIRSRPEEAEAVTEDLADLFRYSLRASKQPTVTLAEELEAIDTYLAIERARLRERLDVSIEVPGDLRDVQIPSVVLQPLVENAVKHGISETLERCRIVVRAERQGERVRLRVTDTGPGFASTDPGIVLGHGTGLANVRDRLRHLFDEAGRLTILRNGVEVEFPCRQAAARTP